MLSHRLLLHVSISVQCPGWWHLPDQASLLLLAAEGMDENAGRLSQ